MYSSTQNDSRCSAPRSLLASTETVQFHMVKFSLVNSTVGVFSCSNSNVENPDPLSRGHRCERVRDRILVQRDRYLKFPREVFMENNSFGSPCLPGKSSVPDEVPPDNNSQVVKIHEDTQYRIGTPAVSSQLVLNGSDRASWRLLSRLCCRGITIFKEHSKPMKHLTPVVTQMNYDNAAKITNHKRQRTEETTASLRLQSINHRIEESKKGRAPSRIMWVV